MGKEERIIFALGFVALVALVIFSRNGAPMLGPAATEPPETKASPIDYSDDHLTNYLTYNQSWLFAPPVGNVLPQVASGNTGIPLPDSNAPFDCGCT